MRVADPKACQCGEVLKGVIKPWECKVFGTACTPEHPIGTCMVSSEGACAAYYNFGRLARRQREPLTAERVVVTTIRPTSPFAVRRRTMNARHSRVIARRAAHAGALPR